MSFIEEFISNASPGIAADILNEPWNIRSAVYQASPSQINVVMGPGRCDFSKAGEVWGSTFNPFTGNFDAGANLVEDFGTTALTISNPTASTVYYIFRGRGGWRTSTDSTLFGNEIRIGYVQAGNPVSNPPSRRDFRSMINPPQGRLARIAQLIYAAASWPSTYGGPWGFTTYYSGGTTVIGFSATGFEQVPQLGFVAIAVDGVQYATSAKFFNDVQNHHTMPAHWFTWGPDQDQSMGGDAQFVGSLGTGRHTLTAYVGGGYTVDGNDRFSSIIYEFPPN